jgi:hypothetical protein
MTTEDAIRFLDHQAKLCRGRDACEALCLLLPAMMRIMDLDQMEDVEALAFRHAFKRSLAALPDSRPAPNVPAFQCQSGRRFASGVHLKNP